MAEWDQLSLMGKARLDLMAEGLEYLMVEHDLPGEIAAVLVAGCFSGE